VWRETETLLFFCYNVRRYFDLGVKRKIGVYRNNRKYVAMIAPILDVHVQCDATSVTWQLSLYQVMN
jgi:hypothetical protein